MGVLPAAWPRLPCGPPLYLHGVWSGAPAACNEARRFLTTYSRCSPGPSAAAVAVCLICCCCSAIRTGWQTGGPADRPLCLSTTLHYTMIDCLRRLLSWYAYTGCCCAVGEQLARAALVYHKLSLRHNQQSGATAHNGLGAKTGHLFFAFAGNLNFVVTFGR